MSPAWELAGSERDVAVLAHENSRSTRKERPKQEHEKIQVGHSRKNDRRFQRSNQPENAICAKSDSTGADAMDRDIVGKRFVAGVGICDQAKVKFVLRLREVSREIFGHFLRTTAAQMRDQQENLVAMCHRPGREY